MPKGSIHYKAFISYNHKDKAIAKKLQHFLEHYQIPAALREDFPGHPFPDNLRLIFRDETALSSGVLSEEIQRYLLCSDFLIVICSENSVSVNKEGKRWVDKEVEMFLDGKAEVDGKVEDKKKQIIPFIYRKKGGLSATQCIPQSVDKLKLKELLSIDILVDGREAAFNKVAAHMLQMDFELVYDRWAVEEAARRRRRRIVGTVAGVTAAVAGYLTWDYYYPHISYFADYVECNNIPVGVHELSRQEIDTRPSHYRIVERKWRVEKVTCSNAYGKPVTPTNFWEAERSATMLIDYDMNGKVSKHICKDEFGKTVMVWNCHPDGKFIDFDTLQGEGIASASSFLTVGKMEAPDVKFVSKVSRFEVKRDPQGRIIKEIFQNISRDDCADENGVWGREYERDLETGQVKRVRYLDKTGGYTCNAQGVGGYALERNPEGEVVKMVFVGKNGVSPVRNDQGWAKLLIARDGEGRIAAQCFADPANRLCNNKYGYALQIFRYGERGVISGIAYFNEQCKACRDGEDVHLVEMDYSYGDLVCVCYRDENGNPHKNSDKVTKVIWKPDTRNGTTRAIYYQEADGSPAKHTGGYCGMRFEYDGRGNMTCLTYLDEKRKPCKCKDGYSKLEWKYNSRGLVEEKSFHGLKGELVKAKEGYAVLKTSYDKYGNTKEQSTWDEHGKLCLWGDGYTKTVLEYDNNGHVVKQEFYGEDGRLRNIGHAMMKWVYDDHGNIVQESYHDKREKLRPGKGGCAVKKCVYDSAGNLKEMRYEDAKGALHKMPDGFAKVFHEWRTDGQLKSESYFDENDQPCLNKDGYFKMERKYTPSGRLEETVFYGKDKERGACVDGTSRIVGIYDADNKLMEEVYYDVDDIPHVNKHGYARAKYMYDEQGDYIKTVYYNAQDKEIHPLRLWLQSPAFSLPNRWVIVMMPL